MGKKLRLSSWNLFRVKLGEFLLLIDRVIDLLVYPSHDLGSMVPWFQLMGRVGM